MTSSAGRETTALPLWEQVVRRMLETGVNFDKPRQGMAILREVLDPVTPPAWPVRICCGDGTVWDEMPDDLDEALCGTRKC